MKNNPTIREALDTHLRNGGCMNDSTTDALYRDAHHISQDAETDYELEDVERWAVSLVG